MKFNIEKDVLVNSLHKVVGPTTAKQNFPILSSVLITTSEKRLKFTTTDLDITTIAFAPAHITERGKTAVPMKRFLSIIRELPAGEINIEQVNHNLFIKCEKVEFKINTLDPKEFPKIEEEKEASFIKLNPVELEEMVKLTSFCVGYEDVNYVLNGILFEIAKDKISMVATDGKRLSFVKRKLPPTQSEINTKLLFILPIKAVNELYKLIKERDEEILLFVEENKVGFDFKDAQFIARPIEGEFPNYSQYIPSPSKDKLTIARRDFFGALRRADLLSTPDYQGVRLELKKANIVVSKSTPQLGEGKETVAATYTGTPLEIGFNPTYIMDVLRNIGNEEISFEFFGGDKPAVLRKEGYVYLVLPMKI